MHLHVAVGYGCDQGVAVLLELGDEVSDRDTGALLNLAVVVGEDVRRGGGRGCGSCGFGYAARFAGRDGRRCVGGRLLGEIEEAGIRPLDRGDVGENLAAVPAVLVAALGEGRGGDGAEGGEGFVARLCEAFDELLFCDGSGMRTPMSISRNARTPCCPRIASRLER